MGKQVKDVVSAVEIDGVRASLLIPLVITAVCSVFDMLFRIKLGMTVIATFEEGLFFVLGTLISYFFPSFLGAASTLLWQYYCGGGWAGIRKGKAGLLGISTLVYFVLYIVYLLYADTYYIVIFTLINVVYVLIVYLRCIDERVLNKAPVTLGNEIEKTPN